MLFHTTCTKTFTFYAAFFGRAGKTSKESSYLGGYRGGLIGITWHIIGSSIVAFFSPITSTFIDSIVFASFLHGFRTGREWF